MDTLNLRMVGDYGARYTGAQASSDARPARLLCGRICGGKGELPCQKQVAAPHPLKRSCFFQNVTLGCSGCTTHAGAESTIVTTLG